MIKVTISNMNKELEIDKINYSLLDILNEGGIEIESICGSKGKCGKCKVIVKNPESVNEITLEEKKSLSEEEIKKGFRLSCLVNLNNNTIIEIPDSSLQKQLRILCEGRSNKILIDPIIKSELIKVKKPLLGNEKSIVDLINEINKEIISVDYPTLKELSNKIEYGLDIKVVRYGNEIIGISEIEKNIYGAAIDIGTTTVVIYLFDLEKGKLVDIESVLNPQVRYGEDVVSRITFSMKNGVEVTNKVIVDEINLMINRLCNRNNISNKSIYEITVVGNTAMHHIFLNINPKTLSFSPFTPILSKSINLKSRELGININPSGNIHVLPIVSGFVGADTIGVLIATEMYKNPEISLAVDIGTNGELVLGNKDKMVSCSCAAGPALEGGHLKFGMRASTGAIESLYIEEDTFNTFYKTINNGKPKGICGSGIIDIVSEMLRVGLLDPSGKIRAHHNERIRKDPLNGQKEFVIEWGDNTEIKKDIVITASDIREIQLAKGAIMTGINILLEKSNITIAQIENLYLAGAFGNFIDIKNAIRIGLLPNIPLDKIISVGNAAGEGAKISLLSRERRMEEDLINKKIGYIELAAEKNFNGEFVMSLNFPKFD
ncbi:MAG: Na(+)-translocating NADH-quinone reductase subunit F [Candidatus Methanofastidiosum methylothiophilum]|uniref:Na(+)-translocating NADH-quinone reductase subunit F n=1 Tax=Candidatus Methanofastidiosum methylothiophilum TaxID=1705564 RepID=A0A150INA4_9EURY|nr:MAG: Na(+)-translocating NADH-quinone reductase subunit F [Candidatus Methanofastidiosum methylthiophilus]KYC46499.1 MAG: Na(+)-translocating NADH-quinone reductase subunit F [Candidatus Methanofastidiosum methylthiophilus]KYC49708.1 MAG: Na(+)-translocating NADH-quinone reductase subunit F [Candidatus Methanofastidiosum methylthiophilus]